MATSFVPCFFSTPKKGFGFFKPKPSALAAVDLPRQLRDLLSYTAPNPAVRKTKRDEKISELREVIIQMMAALYGNAAEETCVKLTHEFFKEDTLRMLITSLPYLDSGLRQDITYVIKYLNRQRVYGRCIASEYMEGNIDLLAMLVPGCHDLELALSYGSILRECIRHQVVAKYILESGHMKKFFKYLQDPHFEIASDVAATFRELLTRHKSTVSEFLSKNYDWFFQEYNSLLESSNYITRRNSLNLLGVMLLDRSNSSVMARYVCSLDNMRIVMNLLRDSNKTIQLEAFRVFKLFPAYQKKPTDIVNVLVANRSKLLRFFSNFSSGKPDEIFESDKAQVVEEITTLKAQPSSTLKAY